jgi:predicted DNA binding CopG/RHH family protein
MKIDADEKDLLESVERGEWKSAAGGKRERTRYARYAKATFRKDRRLNIRLSSKDLEAIQKRALGGLAVPDADRESAAQVRGRAAQRDLDSGLLNRSSEWCNESCDTSVAHRCTRGAAGAGATRATRDD